MPLLLRARRAGYTDVVLSGEGISDRVLLELAERTGPRLTRCKVQASASVTDTGLTALVKQAKNLQLLEVQGLTKPCAGERLEGRPAKCRVPSFGSLCRDPQNPAAAGQNATMRCHNASLCSAGKFLPLVFEGCGQLQALHLSSIAQLNWGPCKAAAATWPALPHLTKLTARGVNLDGEFGVVLAKLPELQDLEVGASQRTVRDACVFGSVCG